MNVPVFTIAKKLIKVLLIVLQGPCSTVRSGGRENIHTLCSISSVLYSSYNKYILYILKVKTAKASVLTIQCCITEDSLDYLIFKKFEGKFQRYVLN